MIRLASLEMHPMDDADRIPAIKEDYGSGMCNITRCCTEVCPEDIQITDDGIIPNHTGFHAFNSQENNKRILDKHTLKVVIIAPWY